MIAQSHVYHCDENKQIHVPVEAYFTPAIRCWKIPQIVLESA